MAIDKFKFISPGVFINEIDESTIPELPERQGPLLIGRFKKGPSNRPIKVSSYNDMVSMFGQPSPGNATGDVWRNGSLTAPTYAAYAAQAWLRNNSPCTRHGCAFTSSSQVILGKWLVAGSENSLLLTLAGFFNSLCLRGAPT